MHFSRWARFSKTENIKEYFYLKNYQEKINENKFNMDFQIAILSNYYYIDLDYKNIYKKKINFN